LASLASLALRLGLLALGLSSTLATAALAQSPAVAELQAFYPRYHEEPSRLDAIRRTLEAAVSADPRPEDLVALAWVCYVWGDVRAETRAARIDAYERGRQAARHATELEPRNAQAHFWHAVNMGRLGQVSWGLRSLFLLPKIRGEIRAVLDLDPSFPPIYALAGHVYYEVPGFLGGDPARAEEMYRKGLALDSHFTELRVGLGKALIRQGRIAEGRRELEAALDEKAPRFPADFATKDAREARKALQSVRGQP
jgi:tetratricopeptide (TPR) repeat protein